MVMRACTKCLVVKPLDGFHRHKNGLYGRTSKCKECAIAYSSAYYEKHKEKVSEARVARYKLQAEQCRAYSRQWYRDNKDRALAANKAWAERNQETVRHTKAAWSRRNSDKKAASC